MSQYTDLPADAAEIVRARSVIRTDARIEDVARACDVSIMSVSRAMRGVEGVSAATREKVQEAARRLGYQPSSVAGSLAAANSTLIGISVPTLHDEVFSDIFDAMRAVFTRAGFQTVFDTTDYALDREAAWVERMLAWRPGGLVLAGTNHTDEARRLLRHSGRPVLEIWDHDDDAGSGAIDMVLGIDHRAAGELMAHTMLARGYRKPAWVGPDEGFDARAEARLEGFADVFAEAGHPLVHKGRVGQPHSFEGGLSGTRTCLADATPDLIFYLNDHMALGGLMECERQGLSVPDDIGLAGFNDLSVNDVLNRRLTTIRTPRREMGEAGARMLVASILNVPQRKVEPMGVTFVDGDTTR